METDRAMVTTRNLAVAPQSMWYEQEVVLYKKRTGVDAQLKSLSKNISEIQIPNKFDQKEILDVLANDFSSDNEWKDTTDKWYAIVKRMGKYRHQVEFFFAGKGYQKEYPSSLWSYLEALRDFYNYTTSGYEEKRFSYACRSINTVDMPLDLTILTDKSFFFEKAAAYSCQEVISRIETAAIRAVRKRDAPTRNIRLAFHAIIRRVPRGIMEGITTKGFHAISEIFDKAREAERRRDQLYLLLRIWSADTLEDIIDGANIDIRKVPDEPYAECLSRFRSAVTDFEEFLMQEFWNQFLEATSLEDDQLRTSWNRALDEITVY